MHVRPRIDQAAKLADVLLTPGGVAAARAGRPFSLSAFRLVSQVRRRFGAPATVVDVGANKGQFSRAAATAFPGCRLVAFEPLEAVAAEWRANLADVPGAEIHVCALGGEDGTVAFHPHEYSLSSSVLPLVAGAGAEGGGGAGELAPVEVPVRRLDDVLADEELRGPVLAKLDVQGYELEVLRGAAGTLRRVDALVVELAFEQHYEGQPLFTDLLGALAESGFALDVPIDVRRDETGTVVEMDGLFLPAR
ncbi:MAG: FkbM family methyltransferase [Acidimicrobiales bacterium]|nr:FkbM family methyltransferase [Acidimicrobiales bacterium]